MSDRSSAQAEDLPASISAMHQPSFSIVIPTYQRRDSVCAVVRRLSEQTYSGPAEAVVVVDGSTDGSAAALARLECPFPLSIIEQKNGGAGAARNRGAAVSSGEIILFLDDDMMCAPDLLDQHAQMYREGADAVTGEITPREALPDTFHWKDVVPATPERGSPATPFDTFTGQLSVKRAVFADVGGFDECFTGNGGYGNEDFDFGARLIEKYDVRQNPAAVTVHLGAIDRREVLHRAKRLASADVRFAAKHPQFAPELFERRGASALSTRLLYRPISRFPFVAPLMTALASVEVRLSSARLSAKPSRLFSIAYAISYWSGVTTNLTLSRSKKRL